MFNGFCHVAAWGSLGNLGTWGSLGTLGLWGWLGLISNLVLWVGFMGGLTVLVVWAIRRGRGPAASGQPTTMEMLQAQYARGEITREQYGLKKQDIG